MSELILPYAVLVSVLAPVVLWLHKRRNHVKADYSSRVRRRLDTESARRVQLVAEIDGAADADHLRAIVQLSVDVLLEQLHSGQLQAVKVLKAYQAKALEVTRKVNCVTEFVWEAESRAAALDLLPADGRGPLHGLPVSVKESVYLQGYDSTGGLAKNLHRPVSLTAHTLQTLIDLGAVPFCKTNVPQTLLSFGCSNPVYGVTTGLWSDDRVPGGSSGGEGALVGAGGSPLGVGTDLAGSVRVPALFCGCCGFKPTVGRVSYHGNTTNSPSFITPCSTMGFLARESATIALTMRLLTTPTSQIDGHEDMYSRDSLLPPVYWTPQLASERRVWKIGYLDSFPFAPTTPGCRRAVTHAVNALQLSGHQLQPFQLPVDADMLQLCAQLVQPDNGAGMARVMRGELVDSCVDTFMLQLSVPRLLWKPLAWLLSPWLRFIPCKLRGYLSSSEETVERLGVRDRYLSDLMKRWNKEQLDVLILPGFMFPAPPRRYGARLSFGCMYTILFNVLNLPAGVVPVTTETESDQTALSSYPRHPVELRWVAEATRGAVGEALGVQVVGLRWRDETVIAAMQMLENVLQRYPPTDDLKTVA